MRAAVTGASGFLGINVVNALVDAGHEVLAIDRIESEHLPAGVQFRQGDVLDPDGMRDLLTGVDTVFHLVAVITLEQETDELAWRVNVDGVRVTAEAALAADVDRFVLCSSLHAFDQHGQEPGFFLDESCARSESPALPVYDRSKYAGEVELRKVIAEGLDGVICNPTGIIGPVDHTDSRVNAVFLDAARGRVPAMIEGGFDWVDVRDVAQGLLLAAELGRTGNNYILGGHRRDMIEVVRLSAEAAGRRGPRIQIPFRVIRPLLPIMDTVAGWFGSDVMSGAALGAVIANPVVSHTKAATELGYAPRPIEETMSDLVSFHVAQGKVTRRRPRGARRRIGGPQPAGGLAGN